MSQDAAQIVMQTLWNAGYEAYIVGGCVRDQFLHKTPKDWDVVTNARPEQVIPLFEKTIQVGARFGVVIAVINPPPHLTGGQVEIATYRSDGAYSDGRRPDEVKYSDSVKEDVQRRDFTMNGLIAGVAGNGIWPHIRDYVGGEKDIQKKLIRTIGDPQERFTEDPLRMLRAVRFVAQLGFRIEPSTMAAIQDNAKRLNLVSRERIREEMIKLLLAPEPGEGIAQLMRSGLYRYVFGDLPVRGELLVSLLETIKYGCNRTPAFVLGLVASTLSWARVDEFCEIFKVSALEREIIYEMQSWRDVKEIKINSSTPRAWKKRKLRRTGAEETLSLFYAYCKIGHIVYHDDLNEVMTCVAVMKSEGLEPDRLLNGHELMAFGFKGDVIGMAARELEAAQLEGLVGTKEEAIKFLEKWKNK